MAASTSTLARSAGPTLTRTLLNLLSPSLPQSPGPFSPQSASPRRPNKFELQAVLSRAQVRTQARRIAYMNLGRGLPEGVFPRTTRAVAGLNFYIPPSPSPSPTANSPRFPPSAPSPSQLPSPSLAFSPSLMFSPTLHTRPLPSPPIYATKKRVQAFQPGLRFGLGITDSSRENLCPTWHTDYAPRAHNCLARDFPRTPGAPLIGAGSLRGQHHYAEDDTEAYYHLPAGLLTPMTPVVFENAGSESQDYFSQT